ncbi:MAG TPA: hypothetical protein VFU07_03280 [Candidatus Lumbricidophila sp.]|nr:hypothetical protein [Candidatus Lumbricidophila sp.]
MMTDQPRFLPSLIVASLVAAAAWIFVNLFYFGAGVFGVTIDGRASITPWFDSSQEQLCSGVYAPVLILSQLLIRHRWARVIPIIIELLTIISLESWAGRRIDGATVAAAFIFIVGAAIFVSVLPELLGGGVIANGIVPIVGVIAGLARGLPGECVVWFGAGVVLVTTRAIVAWKNRSQPSPSVAKFLGALFAHVVAAGLLVGAPFICLIGSH